MSTEEIIQRTRLLDSEIKVGIQAPVILAVSLGEEWGPQFPP